MAYLRILLVPLLLAVSGCSSFRGEWRSALARPVAEESIEGAWQGEWLSHVNGHNGRLRCVVTRLSEDEYRAFFHAKYRKVLSFSYPVILKTEPSTDRVRFSGEADLGRLAGGVYHYEGHATPADFFSTYRSKYDRGVFEMTRPK